MDWHDYQQATAGFFRRLGYTAEVDAHIAGVRAGHDIDVWVTFETYGISYRWVVECKWWKTPVPKEKVAALRDIVMDVGADRGFLIAESGFQLGAHAAASYSNIVLTTLRELERRASSELLADILTKSSIEAQSLQRRLQQAALAAGVTTDALRNATPRLAVLYAAESAIRGRTDWTIRDALDALSAIASGAVQARDGRLPVHVLDQSTGDMILAQSVEEFIIAADATLLSVGSLVSLLGHIESASQGGEGATQS